MLLTERKQNKMENKKKIEVDGVLERFDASISAEEIKTIGQRLIPSSLMNDGRGSIEISLNGKEAKRFHNFLFNKEGTDIKIKVIAK